MAYWGTVECSHNFAFATSTALFYGVGASYPQACTYTYSDWGACQPDNTQTRTVLTATPEGCVGTPVLSQSCGGLIAHWSFDNCDATDDSGNNDGTLYENPQCIDGKIGKAFSFDGNNYIEVPHSDALNPTEAVTISLWAKENSDSPSYSSLIYKAGGEPVGWCGDRVYSLWTKSDKGIHFASTPEGSTDQMICDSPGNLYQLGEYVHIVGVIDTVSSNTMSIYVNGQKVSTCAYGDSIRSGNYPLRIGGHFHYSGDQFNFNGVIDDVRIYNRALSEAEIQALYGGQFIIVDSGAEWRYTEMEQLGWNEISFDDSQWNTGITPFDDHSVTGWCDFGGNGTNWPLYTSLYLRKNIDVKQQGDLILRIAIDNDFLLYFDGNEVAAINSEGCPYKWEYQYNIPSVNAGTHTIALKITDRGDDNGFDMMVSQGEAPPPPPTCTYTYSDWGACQPDNTQTRTVLTATPEGCVGTPVLSQSCTYVPPGNLEVFPSSYDFGEFTVGSCSINPKVFVLGNTGSGDINISNISVSDNINFTLSTTGALNSCIVSNPIIKPGEFCTLRVYFCPSVSGTIGANLVVTSNDSDTRVIDMPLSGFGSSKTIKSVLSVSPTFLDFGIMEIGSTKDLQFSITNNGQGVVSGTMVVNKPFSLVTGNSFNLQPGKVQMVTVRFNPTTIGSPLNTVSINSNGGNVSVTVRGKATEQAPPIIELHINSALIKDEQKLRESDVRNKFHEKMAEFRMSAITSDMDACLIGALDATVGGEQAEEVKNALELLGMTLIKTPLSLVTTGTFIGDTCLKLGTHLLDTSIRRTPIEEATLKYVTEQTTGLILAEALSGASKYFGLILDPATEQLIEKLVNKEDLIHWEYNFNNALAKFPPPAFPYNKVNVKVFYNPYNHILSAIINSNCQRNAGNTEDNIYVFTAELKKTKNGIFKNDIEFGDWEFYRVTAK
jgi:hypothetical protein